VDGIGFISVARPPGRVAFDIDQNSPSATLDGELGYPGLGRKLFLVSNRGRLFEQTKNRRRFERLVL
jgi:hypothetical protein